MSDGSLSQDEIDALLQGSGGMDFDTGPAEVSLDDQQLGQFKSIVEGTIDSQQSNLSMLVSNEVSLKVASVDVISSDHVPGTLPAKMVMITINLTEGTPGQHIYVLDEPAALGIAGPTMGQEGLELDDASVNALQEAFSQISGPVITALGEKAGVAVMNDPPVGAITDPGSVRLPEGDLVRVAYEVTIGGETQFQIHEFFEAGVIVAALGVGAGAGSSVGVSGMSDVDMGFGGLMAGAASGSDSGGMQMGALGGLGGPSVQSVQFPGLTPAGVSSEQGNIGLLMDVYMEMTVELGRTRRLIKEILGMGEGTIIELDKLAGEPVDILVNHKLIAKGEVVVIDENFGVRVTEIVSPMDRMGSGMP